MSEACLFSAMSIQQLLHRGMVDLAIDVLGSKLSFKLTDNLFAVENLDLLNQTIES